MSPTERMNILLIHPDQQRHDCLGLTSGGVRARWPRRRLEQGRKLAMVKGNG